MVKLVWKVSGQAPLAFPLRQERVSIGRDAGNDVRLPEAAVSSRHATLIQKGGRVVLHDLKSSNGTWVNGTRIDNQELVHGDLVAFGRVVMHFVDESQEEIEATIPRPAVDSAPKRQVAAPTPSLSQSTPQPIPAPLPAAPPVAAPPPPPPAPASPPLLTMPEPATARVAPTPAPFNPESTLNSLLRPMAPPPQPLFVPKPEFEAPRLPDALDATLPPRAALSEVDSSQPDLAELDRLLGSIRSFRDQETDQMRQRQAELLREWRATISYAEAMRGKLAGETRIRYFDVSERRHEIVLRIVRGPNEPMRLISLTWGHPEQRDKAPDGIWMRATNQPDRRFQKSTEAVRELVAILALFLA